MRVNKKDPKAVPYYLLQPGEVFYVGGGYFMRLNHGLDAAVLETGDIQTFNNPKTQVFRINGHFQEVG